MNKGQGAIARTNKAELMGGLPVIGADNGLTVVAGLVELGGTNPLLHNTDIDPGIFDLQITDSGIRNFLSLKPSALTYGIGDLAAFNNRTNFFISDNVQQAEVSSNGFSMLFLNMATGIFQLGASAGGSANLTYLEVNDAARFISTASMGNVNVMALDMAGYGVQLGDFAGLSGGTNWTINDTALFIQGGDIAGRWIALDGSNRIYRIGDVDLANSGNVLVIDDTNSLVNIFQSGRLHFQVDNINQLYQIGDLSAASGSTTFVVNDAATSITTTLAGFYVIQDVAANPFFFINQGGGSSSWGDIAGTVTVSYLNINWGTGAIHSTSPLGFGVNINPIASPFAVAGLAAFANNAAAVAGGLNVGDFYRISVAGTSAVAIVE